MKDRKQTIIDFIKKREIRVPLCATKSDLLSALNSNLLKFEKSIFSNNF